MKYLLESININSTCVGVLGLGYVGLLLALAFSKKFQTIGFDAIKKCTNLMNDRLSYIPDIKHVDI
ncbi:hypothetical protein [Methanosarcina siciliae]|uniref:hypothetical protein n=1 Tax=Methanosarcina siciliae TaxID=38027 RepID=UPI00064F379B|nr:hypothetical protein [Methanosarcina siciliae]